MAYLLENKDSQTEDRETEHKHHQKIGSHLRARTFLINLQIERDWQYETNLQ